MEIKEGDKVRIKRGIVEKIKKGEIGGRLDGVGEGLYFNWNSMEEYEGKECEVELVIRDSLKQTKLVGVDWTWREDWLEPVLPKGLEGAVKLA